MFCLICVIVIDTAKKRLNYAPLHSLTLTRARRDERERRERAKEIWVTTTLATASELKGGRKSSFHDWICEGSKGDWVGRGFTGKVQTCCCDISCLRYCPGRVEPPPSENNKVSSLHFRPRRVPSRSSTCQSAR